MSRPSLGPQSDQLSAPQSCPSSTIPSPAPSTEASFATSNTTPLSEIGVRGDEPDPTIIEALGTKDRLFVLKLGDEFEKLLNERGSTPGKRCTYSVASSYQRMLVHRCAQYYRLTVEVEGKTIAVSVGQESRVPKSRIAEIAPQEKTAAPAFKIMRRNADERVRAKQPGRSDSTEDDQGDGTAATDEAKRRTQMTIEERTAAYEQARSRIFEGFQEKEAQPSPPPAKRDSGNSEGRWADKQRRPDLSSSSRGSPAPQDGISIPAHYYPPMLFNPNAPSGQVQVQSPHSYDPSAGQQMQYSMYGPQPAYYPMYGYYPQPQYDPRQGPPGMQMYPPPPQGTYPSFPPQHAATWPQMQHAQPPPPMQFQPQPQSQGQLMSPPVDAQRYAFPPMTPTQQQQGRPAPSMPPPMPPQMQGHMQMMPQQQNDPFPPAQYMQPYQYGGMMHQPVLVPTPTDGPSSAHSSRSVSRNGHGQGPGSVGSNGGGAKGPRGSGHPSPWSSVSTVATPMRNVTGMGRRLSASSSSTSAYSSSGGGPGSGSRTPADETASVASSTSSSSSRRTYTSTSTTSKHPLPPRPDWAVGLIPDPPLSRTTSSSSTDSRLRLGSRSSSGNQIPRASSVKHSVANASDFPPLNGNGNSNGGMNGGIRAGAWVRDGSPASLFGNAPNPMAVGIGPNNSSTGSLNTTSSGGNVPPNANASANPHRFDATEGFGRPPPKSFGLYNPGTGTGPAALPVQVRSVQEGGSNPSPSATSGDVLADQVAKLSVADGDKAA
ncbi:SUZ domain protein [Ceratobasidium sp. AG-Ba]|nr:SUZ domain protein [Ceratobasidium sp. AG-Ba]